MALSTLSRDCTHHVFPSFHGEDVRRGLHGCLSKEFKEKGIDVFIDNDMDRNKSIGPELIKAIRGSMIAIVLFSKNYASSTWCLDELVEITKCRKEQNQITMVVFCEVEPSDVKKQSGYFGDVFKKTCTGKTEEKVERWKQALEEVAQISGYDSLKWDCDALLAVKLATDISKTLNDSSASNDSKGLVGVENHIEKVESLLCLDSDEVRMVGIWGPAGIGKTTIARALHKKLKIQFTHHAFIDSFKGKFEQNYHQDEHAFMLHLQEQLLSQTLNQQDLKIGTLDAVEARLKHKKVLVVLDDVHELTQLEAMTNNTSWFGRRSRIIITTKNKQLLKAHEINHVYNVGYPSQPEALEILCQSAFRQNSPPFEFNDMVYEVTRLAGNLPLGLKVFGAYLRGMSKDEWTNALSRLRTSLDGKIEKVLRFSYDALCYKDQELFLHIACFFKGEHISDVVKCLESRLNVNHGLKVLCDKSFVSIDECGWLVVHNLLDQLAKEIVRRQSDNPGKRQFLMDAQEISDVLSENTGSETIQGVDLNLSEMREDIAVHKKAFKGMSGLQFLRFKSSRYKEAKIVLPEGLKFRGNKLRILQWDVCPMTMLPCEFHPRFLVKLEMRNSKLKKLWEEPIPFPCLKKIDLDGSYNLKNLPNLSKATNLEVLKASFCTSLVEIPSTIGEVTSLQELDLWCCFNLMEIPSSIGNAINIKWLNFASCESLVELPSSIWSLKRLENLGILNCSKLKHLGDTSIEEFPSSITAFSQLITSPETSAKITELNTSNTAIEEFPSSIMALSCLRTLITSDCISLKVFPNVPESIVVLILENTAIEEVPSSIQNLSSLSKLSMHRCEKLKILPSNINLESLTSLDLSDCTQLKTFPEISTSIVNLYLSNTAIEEVPSSIQNLSSLTTLRMEECEKLKILPSNINLESLTSLDLSFCTRLKTFPEISTSIVNLNMKNTAIEEVPSSIWSWFRLEELNLKDCESLFKVDLQEWNLSNTETDSLDGVSATLRAGRRLSIKLNGCINLVSLPHFPDFVKFLDAIGCELLQRVDGFSDNPYISLNFGNCFNLSEESKELIWRCKLAYLPGKELPGYFDHQAKGDSLTINLEDQRPLPLFLRFKPCLLLVEEYDTEEDEDYDKKLSCCVWGVDDNGVDVGYGSCKYHLPALLGLEEHLCFFESSIYIRLPETDVKLSELVFEFEITGRRGCQYWKIEECGVDFGYGRLNEADISDSKIREIISRVESQSKKRRRR